MVRRSKASTPGPPRHLGTHGKRFWKRVVENFELLDQDFDRLEGACVALDRAHAARQLLDREGLVVLDRFQQPKEHPAVRIEAAAWGTFRLLVRELAIDDEPPADTRPRAGRGYR